MNINNILAFAQCERTFVVADPGFCRTGTPISKVGVLTIILQFFVENFMKMKEFGPRIRQCFA